MALVKKFKVHVPYIVLIGLFAPFWWTWAANNLTYAMFLAAGSPTRPSSTFAHASIILPSIALGLLVGAVVTSLAIRKPLLGWLVFWLSTIVGITLYGVALHSSPTWVIELFKSNGNVSFIAASAVIPAFIALRRTK